MQPHQGIRGLLSGMRRRWRRLLVFRATVRAGLAISGVLGAFVLLTSLTNRAPAANAALALAALASAVAALSWGFWHLRRVPTDAQLARYIEERDPSLDDRLVSAVDL